MDVVKEVEDLTGYVPVQYIIWTVIVLLVIVVAAIKIIPLIKKWFESARQMANYRDELDRRLEKCTQDIKDITQELSNINTRCVGSQSQVNKIAEITQKQQQYIEDSMEERELIIRSLLGVVQGLQEVGADGPTKKAEKEIQDYLVKKSHRTPDDDVNLVR